MNNYKTIILLLFIFNTSLVINAQNDCYATIEQLLEKKDFENVLPIVDECLTANPKDVGLYETKFAILNKLGQEYDALTCLKQGIEKNPKSSRLLMFRANQYYFTGYFDLAIMDNTNALKHVENNDSLKIEILSNLASAKHGKRDFEGAIKDYETALQINPEELSVLNNIAASYNAVGKKETAIEYYEKVLAMNSLYIPTLTSIGFLYSKDGYYKKALKYIDKAIEIQPEEALNYNNRGYIKYKMGELEAAEKDVNYSLSLYPENSYAYRNKALIFIEKKQTEQACEMMKQAIHFGFTIMYGDEVETLINKHCQP